jgi:hypothetical protein
VASDHLSQNFIVYPATVATQVLAETDTLKSRCGRATFWRSDQLFPEMTTLLSWAGQKLVAIFFPPV